MPIDRFIVDEFIDRVSIIGEVDVCLDTFTKKTTLTADKFFDVTEPDAFVFGVFF